MTRKEELTILISEVRNQIKDTNYHDILLKLATSLVRYLEEYESLK